MVESKYGSLAQLAEQETFNLKVKGSTPLRPTMGHEARGQNPWPFHMDGRPRAARAKDLAKELLFGYACFVSRVLEPYPGLESESGSLPLLGSSSEISGSG